MRKLALVLLMFPILASAASRTPQIAFFRDGKVERLPAPIERGRARVIVEFQSVPLARSKNRLQSQAAARTTLDRFRRDLESTISTESLSRRAVIEHEYVNAFSGAAVTLDQSTLARVKSLSYVRGVTYDVPVRASVEPGIAAVRAPEVWSGLANRGAGVTVAIIDTGIDYMHSSLGGGFGPGFKVVGGYDFANKDDDPIDDAGHGTHVAGIVAGNSAELLGVAPDAKLVAFKVLNENGFGWGADIIAAIERCIDPNGDGDFSDRVDVANMSLGGFGNPEDEMSRAVDTAVEAGIVFVIAAGNAGMPQTIGSPGTSERAITVGATMPDGALAVFSSRGPNALHYSIKPDVVAPGVFVRSAQRGGGLIEHSGTSMAAPHVAGVAALLRALHPDWSADRIKSAIVSTAQGETQSVMGVGGGSVDAFRAANAVTEVQPPSLSFGVTDGATPSYSRSITLTITNHGDSARTYTMSMFDAPDGITFELPATLMLAANEARQVSITVHVDHTKIGFPDDLAFDGLLELDADGEHVRVPWAVAKGVRVHLAYTEGDHFVSAGLGQTGKADWPLARLSANAFETLATPGQYDLTVVALPLSDELEPAVMYFEQQDVFSDRRFDLGYFADAPYVTNFSGQDEAGVPLTGFSSPGGCITFRTVEFPGNRGIEFFSFELGWSALRTNALSSTSTLFASDFCIDPSHSRFYGLHFEPVRGVSESLLRFGGGNALIGQKVEVRIPGPAEATQRIEFGVALHLGGNPAGSSAFFGIPYEPRRWSGLAYVTPENDGNVQYLPMIATSSEGSGQHATLGSAVLRVVNGKVTSFAGPRAGLTTDYGETISLGSGAVIPRLVMESAIDGMRTYLGVSVIGQLEEPRRPGIPIGVALFDEFGGEILNNGVWAEVDNLDRRMTLKADGETHEIGGAPGRMRFSATFGGPQEDKLPPVLTSMLLRDRAGRRIIERVQRGTLTRVTFAVFDNGLIEGKTALRVRHGQFGEWIPVPLAIQGHEELRGTFYEGNLQLQEKGHYDLEVSVEDASGNSTVALLSPVLEVVEGKLRSVRR